MMFNYQQSQVLDIQLLAEIKQFWMTIRQGNLFNFTVIFLVSVSSS